jgi:hypothetical protein
MKNLFLVAGIVFVSLSSAHAEVYVLGNTETGQIVIRGNTSDAGMSAAHEAKDIRQTGWVQLLADDVRG